MWNDKVLGNCFTFNHMNSSFQYKARESGYSGGLEMQMNVKQSEYLPWTDTAAVMVFTSTKEEVVTSESVRINTAPHFESRIAINRVNQKIIRLPDPVTISERLLSSGWKIWEVREGNQRSQIVLLRWGLHYGCERKRDEVEEKE